MAQIVSIRMPDGSDYRPEDWTTAEPLWSTVEIGPGFFPLVKAFAYSRGAGVPGSPTNRTANWNDTNLEGQGGMLPENETLIIHNISCDVFKIGPAADLNVFPDAEQPEVPLPDMLRMQRDLNVNLEIAAVKDYTASPIGYWPAGQGVSHMYSGGLSRAAGGLSGSVVATNGSPNTCDARYLGLPLGIQGGESFGVRFSCGPGEILGLNLAPTSRLRIRVFLDGRRKRPVA
jgi:hypothetical protein